jgi:hypothetical protein
MAVFIGQSAFTVGEVGPALYGRFDLARFGVGAATMRNAFVRYAGGASSRAGTRFVGFSKQTGRAYPPRLVNFQFNINQGLVLEFGHQYMRVIENGEFVLESPVAITGITQSSPGVVSTAAALGAISASPNNGGVTISYAPGDDVSLAGGTFLTRAVALVDTTRLLSLSVNDPGIANYVPADTIAITGGMQTTPAVLTVATTQVVSATIASSGAGGSDGTQTVTGTTGTGTKFQASVTVAGGTITDILSITVPGSYTVNPTTPAVEPVTGAGLAGAELNVVLGVGSVTVTNPGVFTVNPSGLTFTQTSSSGTGTGVTFRYALMGVDAVTFSPAGSYTVFPANPVAQFDTTGLGRGVTFNVVSGAVGPFSDGDWVYLNDVIGMTQVNEQTYVVANATPMSFELRDVYGNNVSTAAFNAYVSGGTASRIYTLGTPYNEEDLPYLKWTQSKDVMSLCLVNQQTGVEYQTRDLARLANNNWQFEENIGVSSVSPPATLTGEASGSGSTNYQYVVTSVDAGSGEESVASPIASISSAVNIATTAGSIRLNWTAVEGVKQYNVYKASPSQSFPVPPGALFGYAGTVYGTQFIDSNIVADMAQVPPLHTDPFARGVILGATPVSGGVGYSSATATIATSTGSGVQIEVVINGGAVTGLIVIDGGEGYVDTDTVSISGDGAGATAVLEIGPQSGTFPSTASYLQQRRAYANTLNRPDTYFLSVPGAFTNFDRRIPTIDSDAITGNPWAVQVNGIQWIVNMPGGGLVFTGADIWQLTGNGGSSLTPQPITPATQQAQPQAYNGSAPTVAPQKIEDSILYVQNKGSIWRSLTYNYLNNIYAGVDLTLNSPQLFTGFTTLERAWCEEPFKTMWAIRNDGIMLSLTFVKAQEVAGWSRHDTQGIFVSCTSVTELPVDVLYVATKRPIGNNTPYMIERMDDRLWDTVEDAWCVDAGLTLYQPTPAASLQASSATGLGAISGVTDLMGGADYSGAVRIEITDQNVNGNGAGPGTGATASATVVGRVITAIAIDTAGANYLNPKITIFDDENTGVGASARPILNNEADFTASAPVFAVSDEGSTIRLGGGVIEITQYVSPTEVTGDIISPIVALVPETESPAAAEAGDWTLTAPVSSISGLTYLAGATVIGTYDGKKLPPVLVPANGIIPLPSPATQVTVGLGFTAQVQTLYLNPPGMTWQGRRKKVAAVVARVESSGSFRIGANQPDGATQSPISLAPTWQGMVDAETKPVTPYNSTTRPLWTGDIRVPITGGFDVKGQAAFEQSDPFPLNLLSVVDEALDGDEPEGDPPKQPSRK